MGGMIELPKSRRSVRGVVSDDLSTATTKASGLNRWQNCAKPDRWEQTHKRLFLDLGDCVFTEIPPCRKNIVAVFGLSMFASHSLAVVDPLDAEVG